MPFWLKLGFNPCASITVDTTAQVTLRRKNNPPPLPTSVIVGSVVGLVRPLVTKPLTPVTTEGHLVSVIKLSSLHPLL
jgi:hypothetical protein